MTTRNAAPVFWRTLDELADDPSFRERLYNEFPSEVEAITDEATRRTFLKLMGASMALAGLTACTRQPEEKIVAYVRQPEDTIPGKPLFYATTMALGGMAKAARPRSREILSIRPVWARAMSLRRPRFLVSTTPIEPERCRTWVKSARGRRFSG
jgi:MoCo/4Fe-4S cofactor protein with predicted Tat translocation signal